MPVLVLVGRQNTGKSTLFNRLTRSRDALVAEYAGLTRDRQYGRGYFEGRHYMLVDTGGLSPDSADPVAALAEQQAQIALAEADRILFLVDARTGILPADRDIAASLRKLGKPITLLSNKSEGLGMSAASEFYALGLGEPLPISAEHGDGVWPMMQRLLEKTPLWEEAEPPEQDGTIRVAVVGRPNAGKSTLVNRLIGEERVLSSDQPGTTRDAIRVQFTWDRHLLELIDTAGIRRRARVFDSIEKFSVIKALQAIERAHVVIVMVDAQCEIGSLDARLMGLVAERGRAMVLAVNKWDCLTAARRHLISEAVDYRLPFLDYVPVHTISALHGSGFRELMSDVIAAYRATTSEIPTPELNRVLIDAVRKHSPHAVLGRRIKLRYAHQSGRNPTTIMIHGNQTEKLMDSYKSYLANAFRKAFNLRGVPLKLQFKTGDNPFRDLGRKRREDASRRRRLGEPRPTHR